MSVSIKVQNALNIGVRIAAYVYDNDRGEQQKVEAIKALKTEVRQQQYKLRKRTINAPGNSLCILFYFAFVSLLAARLPMIAISAAQFWHRMFMTYQTNIIWARQVSRWYNDIGIMHWRIMISIQKFICKQTFWMHVSNPSPAQVSNMEKHGNSQIFAITESY